jgi:hypothetical protein
VLVGLASIGDVLVVAFLQRPGMGSLEHVTAGSSSNVVGGAQVPVVAVGGDGGGCSDTPPFPGWNEPAAQAPPPPRATGGEGTVPRGGALGAVRTAASRGKKGRASVLFVLKTSNCKWSTG